MANNEETQTEDRQHARPEDPDTNTRPPGNGDADQQDIEHGQEKLDSVLGQ